MFIHTNTFSNVPNTPYHTTIHPWILIWIAMQVGRQVSRQATRQAGILPLTDHKAFLIKEGTETARADHHITREHLVYWK